MEKEALVFFNKFIQIFQSISAKIYYDMSLLDIYANFYLDEKLKESPKNDYFDFAHFSSSNTIKNIKKEQKI